MKEESKSEVGWLGDECAGCGNYPHAYSSARMGQGMNEPKPVPREHKL